MRFHTRKGLRSEKYTDGTQFVFSGDNCYLCPVAIRNNESLEPVQVVRFGRVFCLFLD